MGLRGTRLSLSMINPLITTVSPTRCFFFAAILLLASCSGKEKMSEPDCSKVRNGDFHILRDGEVETTISRTGDVQVERLSSGSVSRFRVQWLDSCRYRLTYISGSEEKALRPVLVQILEVKDSSYIVEGRVEGSAFGTTKVELFRSGASSPPRVQD